jgi:NADH-quinone oxidoreductase subunit E
MEATASQLIELIQPFKGQAGVTIPVLQAIQTNVGYLPPESFDLIEQELGIPASKAYGVATFYAQFRMSPVGKNIIKVCDGTACHVKGSETIATAIRDHLGVPEGEDTTTDRVFTVEEVACLGCCLLAPVMMIGETTYGNPNVEKTREILDEYRAKEA